MISWQKDQRREETEGEMQNAIQMNFTQRLFHKSYNDSASTEVGYVTSIR
jgi:hypothetical protein